MSCHTWVYKRIDSMSREEINQEIDCVINERLSRAYMSENEEEYANKMVKLTKDSSISPLSYSDAIKRYKEARYETSLIVKKLQEAKRTGDLSLITDINGFDTAENNTYLFLCNDMPFRCYDYTDKQCYNKDELIEFVHTVEPNNIAIYDENNICLSFKDTLSIFSEFGIQYPEVFYDGKFEDYKHENVMATINRFDYEIEGYVLRSKGSFHYNDHYNNVVKYVRKNHINSDNHWMYKKIERNELSM